MTQHHKAHDEKAKAADAPKAAEAKASTSASTASHATSTTHKPAPFPGDDDKGEKGQAAKATTSRKKTSAADYDAELLEAAKAMRAAERKDETDRVTSPSASAKAALDRFRWVTDAAEFGWDLGDCPHGKAGDEPKGKADDRA